MSLNFPEPAYFVHVSSVFILSLRVYDMNRPLFIGPHQFFTSSFYWSPGKIQSFSSLDQVNLFILASGYVPYQVTKDPSSSLHNPPHKGASILSPKPTTFSDHFITTIVDIYPSGSWLIVFSPYGSKPSICVEYFSPHQRRNHDQVDPLLEATTIPNPDQAVP